MSPFWSWLAGKPSDAPAWKPDPRTLQWVARCLARGARTQAEGTTDRSKHHAEALIAASKSFLETAGEK